MAPDTCECLPGFSGDTCYVRKFLSAKKFVEIIPEIIIEIIIEIISEIISEIIFQHVQIVTMVRTVNMNVSVASIQPAMLKPENVFVMMDGKEVFVMKNVDQVTMVQNVLNSVIVMVTVCVIMSTDNVNVIQVGWVQNVGSDVRIHCLDHTVERDVDVSLDTHRPVMREAENVTVCRDGQGQSVERRLT